MFECGDGDGDGDGDSECVYSIKVFNGVICSALNFIDVDVWLYARARFTDFVSVDKSASAASGVFDDVIFSKKVFTCIFEFNNDDDEDIDTFACDCLFDSYTAHSSTLWINFIFLVVCV